MAIFQPTNIIPSYFTQGTVDVNDKMEISWQVNGNSAMIAFQIDFYKNDTASSFVSSTGRIDSYSFQNESGQVLSLPFYGIDRYGKVQFFTWKANKSWLEWSQERQTAKGGNYEVFANGGKYKFKITQWFYSGDSIVSALASAPISSGCYFSLPNGAYIKFPSGFTTLYEDERFYYNINQQKGWYLDENGGFIFVSFIYSDNKPTGSSFDNKGTMTPGGVDAVGDFIIQNSPSAFSTKTKPTVSILQTNNLYSESRPIPSTLRISIAYFKAEYKQNEGDPIRWIRWQVAQVINGRIGTILDDTGNIYTPTLTYNFNGFFNNQHYAIRCIIESEGGQQAYSNPINDGWQIFNIAIENQIEYEGDFTAKRLPEENAVLLEWDGIDAIPPTISPDSYQPTITQSTVTLLGNSQGTGENYSVLWDKIISTNKNTKEYEAGPMNFDAPWCAVWKGKISPSTLDLDYINSTSPVSLSSQESYIGEFSPDGKYWVQVVKLTDGSSNSYLEIFSIDNDAISFLGCITNDGDIVSEYSAFGTIGSIAFSPDGKYFTVGSKSTVHIYRFNDGELIIARRISIGNNTTISALALSPNNELVIGWTVPDNSACFLTAYLLSTMERIYLRSMSGGIIYHIKFNYYGNILLVAGNFGAEYFFIKDNNFKYLGVIFDEIGNTLKPVYGVAFNHNVYTNIVVLQNNSDFYQYEITENEIKFIQKLTAGKYTIKVNEWVNNSISFSKDGKNLLIGSQDTLMRFVVDSNENLKFDWYITPSDGALWSDVRLVAFNEMQNIAIVCSKNSRGYVERRCFNVYYNGEAAYPRGKLFDIQENNLTIVGNSNGLIISVKSVPFLQIKTPVGADTVAVAVSKNNINIFYYGSGELLSKYAKAISYSQSKISSVAIFGGDTGATTDNIAVFKGDGTNVLAYYNNYEFEPVWSSNDYTLLMHVSCNGNLEGGIGTTSGGGFRIYRQEVGTSILTPIATLASTVTSIKDYGILSRKSYKYMLCAYDSNGVFMSTVEADNAISTYFKNYSLLVCDYVEASDEYHVRKQYLFQYDLKEGSIGNNNTPTINKNFTKYPTRSASTSNYKSGTLQGLIGVIYSVPALIEQVENHKNMLNPSTIDYYDSIDLEQELYDLSTSQYYLFIRDMKGRIRMVHTNSQISITTNIKQKQQSSSISFPWVEIGDASNVAIIQTPKDYGWDYDIQVVEVSLDVNIETGELIAKYPIIYSGTKFYLAGSNREILSVKTPYGTTSAKFNLPEIATEPNDGELKATIINNEEK